MSTAKKIILLWLFVLVISGCLIYSCNEDVKRQERDYKILIYKRNIG